MLNNPDPSLINEDIRPTTEEERHWSVINMASLWVGMVVCVPSYLLAGQLVQAGMSAWEAIGTVMLGNIIVLIPMVLNGHPGTKYGVPFPVLARASFGIVGANVPSVIRGLVACGWFGIQTWFGGFAIYQLLNVLTSNALISSDLPVLGINAAELGCFFVFWLIQVAIIWRGIDSIRVLETFAAPFLILMSLCLLGWAYIAADGFGAAFSTPSQFGPGQPKEGQFWSVFLPSLTGMVGFWSTLALNIPDFTRYAKTQQDQVLGQALGLPTTMTLFAFISVAVTSASAGIFGETIADPTILVGRMGGGFVVVLSLFVLSVATLSTNIAANVVSPANALINLAPQSISFRTGGLVTAVIGLVIMPWKLIEDPNGYIFIWLGGIGTLLGPVAGILVADYFIVRKTELSLEGLYQKQGPYTFMSGFNPVALVAFAAGVAPSLPGFLIKATSGADAEGIFGLIYQQAWFVGFFLGLVVHVGGMMLSGGAKE